MGLEPNGRGVVLFVAVALYYSYSYSYSYYYHYYYYYYYYADTYLHMDASRCSDV